MNDAYYRKLIRLVTLRRMRRRAAYKAKVLEDFKRKQMNTMHSAWARATQGYSNQPLRIYEKLS